MILDFEMLPASTRGVNLRRMLTRSKWQAIRADALRAHGERCAICGRRGGRLECHEVWTFDDRQRIQRLSGLIPLCAICHHVKHIGMARRLARAGRLDYWRVVNHYCEVNGCSVDDFYRARDAAYQLAEQRSRHVWRVDVSGFMRRLARSASGRANSWHSEEWDSG